MSGKLRRIKQRRYTMTNAEHKELIKSINPNPNTKHKKVIPVFYHIGMSSNNLYTKKVWGAKRVFILINLEDNVQPSYKEDELEFPVFLTRHWAQKFLMELAIRINRLRVEEQEALTADELEEYK
jgi:hypothetical protein